MDYIASGVSGGSLSRQLTIEAEVVGSNPASDALLQIGMPKSARGRVGEIRRKLTSRKN